VFDRRGTLTSATASGPGNVRAEMGRVMQRRIPNLYHKDRIRRLYEELYDSLAHKHRSVSQLISTAEPNATRARLRKMLPAWAGRRRPVRYA
jgi:hypothetical protein